MAYHQEDLDDIEAMHKEGRLMPFIEFPLIGGKFILRLVRLDGKYVMAMPPEEATGYLKGINQDCWDAGLHNDLKEVAPMAYVHRNEFNEYRLEPTDNFNINDLPVGVDVMLYPRKGGA